jgi:glutamate-1-semialdehyde 2,1-aminomutase
MPRSVAIIQARMGSSRLPGKVLLDLGGRPVLQWVVDAAQVIAGVDDVAVATSTLATDDAVEQWCNERGVICVRGSEQDVLERYSIAAEATHADVVLRITADCPFLDPVVCADVLALSRLTQADLATNADPPTWPEGLSCEVVTTRALMRATREAVKPSEREHVLPYISHRRATFKVRSLLCPLPGMHRERWTLDTEKDYAFLREVAGRLNGAAPPGYLRILDILEKEPELRRINAGIQRNVGAARSREKEAAALARADFETSESLWESGAHSLAGVPIEITGALHPIVLTHGRRGQVWDVDGNRFVDFWGGSPPVILGHGHPDVEIACRDAAANGGNPMFSGVIAERLSRQVSSRFGGNQVLFFTSVEAAWRAVAAVLQGDDHVCADPSSTGLHRKIAGDDSLSPRTPVLVRATGLPEVDAARFAYGREAARRAGVPLVADLSATAFCVAADGRPPKGCADADVVIVGGSIGNGRRIAFAAGDREVLPPQVLPLDTPDGQAFAAAEIVMTTFENSSACEALASTARDACTHLTAISEQHGSAVTFEAVGGLVWRRFAEKVVDSATNLSKALSRELLRYGLIAGDVHRVCLAHDGFDIRQAALAYERAFEILGRDRTLGLHP